MHGIDNNARQPCAVQQPFFQIEIPGSLLLRHQKPLQAICKTANHALYGRELLVRAKVDEKEIVAIEDKVQTEIEEAVKFADESPELAYEKLAEFTYKE